MPPGLLIRDHRPDRMPLADLHTHTTFSDGRLTPPGLIDKAARRGIAVIAVTDHDTVAGLALADFAARRSGLRLVPGVELSADLEGAEVHILGFGFDPEDRRLREHLARFRAGRLERARRMVARLAELGAPIAWNDVRVLAHGGVVARPHVAQALLDAGHVAHIGEAFERFIGDSAPAYVPKPPVQPADVIDLVHRAGGLAFLAHPGDRVTTEALERLVAAGLDGIETVHPSHDDALSVYWYEMATLLGLHTSGGSDYHGYRPGEDERFGTFGIPVEDLTWLDRASGESEG